MKVVTFLVCVATLWANSAQVPSRESRIIGGEPARAGQFPFLVAIYLNTETGRYFCSGTLINNQWTLTAAQCVTGAVLFEIRIGSSSLSATDALELTADLYWAHPDYNPETLENDVGLIKFRQAVTYTDYIKPISLLSSADLPGSSAVTAVGWGQNSDEDAGLVDELNYVDLTTLTNEECRLTYGNQVTDNMVCAAGNFNEGTCIGDVGSPLIQYKGCCLTFHVGLSSFVSGNGCETPDPSGFTKTFAYLDWIRNTTNNN